MAFEIEDGVLKKYIEEEDVTEVVIPDSVTSIGDCAFQECSNLESVVISDSVTSIGDCAFMDCSILKNVKIPDSVTSIGVSAFNGCISLKSVVIPDSVTYIAKGVFGSCSSLESVVIPDSVTSIGDFAFQFCDNIHNVVIPDSVTSIGKEAFAYSSLETVTIPDTVTEIGYGAFFETILYNNPDDDFVIVGDGNLIRIAAEEDVVIPDTVKRICTYAGGTENLIKTLVIPDSVEKIDKDAFKYNTALRSVTFGKSLKEIDPQAFGACGGFDVNAADPAVADLVERQTRLISKVQAKNTVCYFYKMNRENWLEEIKSQKEKVTVSITEHIEQERCIWKASEQKKETPAVSHGSPFDDPSLPF